MPLPTDMCQGDGIFDAYKKFEQNQVVGENNILCKNS